VITGRSKPGSSSSLFSFVRESYVLPHMEGAFEGIPQGSGDDSHSTD